MQFDVERREGDTRVEVCCAAKPGLLLSMVSTLDALGLEIHQCVASCFSDFGMQASCLEVRLAATSISLFQELFVYLFLLFLLMLMVVIRTRSKQSSSALKR